MNRLSEFFSDQRGGIKLGLIVGAVAIVLGTALGGWLLMRPDYQVLFSDLSAQDVGAMTAELDRLKVPYMLGSPEGGGRADGSVGTILVDRADVYRTRIKLMSKDIPLHGAIGFELFNNSDLGMTEFAQKINFQRALQGELTRTILSLTEVRDVRVLLALPEQGLFKQAAARPTASVTLALKAGQKLRVEQVSGIQRLVASAVPGINAQDVTIVDQSGVALTRAAADAADAEGAASSRLDLKQDTESYLARKATAVLDRALGAGTATASIDVTLNMDRVQTNTEEVLGGPAKPGEPQVGLISKERETTRELGAPVMPANGSGAAGGAQGGSNQHEVEYALGRRVEQVITQPGSIRHMQVAVVVHRNLSAAQLDQLRQTVGAAVGASAERGDSVVVQSSEGFGGKGNAATAMDADPGLADKAAVAAPDDGRARAASREPSFNWLVLLAALLGLGALALFLGALLARRRRVEVVRTLSATEREEALRKLRAWMGDSEAAGDRASAAEQMP